MFSRGACSRGPVSDRLALQIRRFRNDPLDAGPGEGYHRRTNLTQNEAAHSKIPWVLAWTRHNQVLDTGINFLKCNGIIGRTIFRFEYKNYKRLLQTSQSSRFSPVRMGDNAFFKKMYRLSWEDQEDWGAVVDAANSSGPPRPPRPRDPMGAMQREYLQAVIKPEQFYSVSVLKQCDDPNAEAPVEFEEEVFSSVYLWRQARIERKLWRYWVEARRKTQGGMRHWRSRCNI